MVYNYKSQSATLSPPDHIWAEVLQQNSQLINNFSLNIVEIPRNPAKCHTTKHKHHPPVSLTGHPLLP